MEVKNIQLRNYQMGAVNSALEFLNKIDEFDLIKMGIISLPTGSGKSFVIADLCHKLNCRVLILQPTKEILEQNYAKLKLYGIDDIGIYSASMNEKTIGKFTYATIGTIINNIELLDNFDNIIVDECHNINPLKRDTQYMKLLYKFKKSFIGLTATPYRLRPVTDKISTKYGNIMYINKSYINYMTNIRGLKSELIYNVDPRDMVGKWWSPYKIIYSDNEKLLKLSKIKLNTNGSDWNDIQLKSYLADQRNINEIIDSIMVAMTHSKRILVFCKYLEQCDLIKFGLYVLGIDSEIVSSKIPKKDRNRIIDDFKSGKVDIILNVGVLSIGFDMPELDCIILARPTMSVTLFYQMFGRVVRPQDGKLGYIYDIMDNVKRFGDPSTFYVGIDSMNKNQLYSGDMQITGKELKSLLL